MLRIITSQTIGLALTALGSAQPGSARAEEIAVVASIKPVHSLVAGVMQGVGTPALLVKGASSPHDYSLRPSDARALDGAQLVFWVGEGMETFLDKPLAALSSDATIVALGEAPGIELLATREGGIWEEQEHEGDAEAHPEHEEGADADSAELDAHAEDEAHAEEEHGDQAHADEAHAELEEPSGEDEHAEHEQGDEHGHEHGRFDMHLWLDPHNAGVMAGAIVAALSEADPENAGTYQSNGRDLLAQLGELDESLNAKLQPIGDRPFVVFHDAYHYFENRYGLNAVGSISVDPKRRPGAQRLGEIQHRLQELDAACVFAEPQFEPALVDTVIEGSSAKKGVLDPLGAALPDGPGQYFLLMNGLAESLVDCLGTAKSG
jgi:zinc transport system substrate-binding protein